MKPRKHATLAALAIASMFLLTGLSPATTVTADETDPVVELLDTTLPPADDATSCAIQMLELTIRQVSGATWDASYSPDLAQMQQELSEGLEAARNLLVWHYQNSGVVNPSSWPPAAQQVWFQLAQAVMLVQGAQASGQGALCTFLANWPPIPYGDVEDTFEQGGVYISFPPVQTNRNWTNEEQGPIGMGGVMGSPGEINNMGDIWKDYYYALCVSLSAAGTKFTGGCGSLYINLFDLDGDGLPNLHEFMWLTNPLDPDTDHDGLSDAREAAYWQDFLTQEWGGTGVEWDPCDQQISIALGLGGVPTVTVCLEAYEDTDDDLIPNYIDPDSDNDGLLDGFELNDKICTWDYVTYGTPPSGTPPGPGWACTWHTGIGTHPGRRDTDGDTLIDGGYWPGLVAFGPNSLPLDGEYWNYTTDPLKQDTDADNFRDDQEVQYLIKRGVAASDVRFKDFDGDGIIAVRDWDDDADGLQDGDEAQMYGSDPYNPDTDGDWMPDGFEQANLLLMTINDANDDRDLDNATNRVEYCYQVAASPCNAWNYLAQGAYWPGGLPVNDKDAEDDWLLDGDELALGADPRDWDTDNDGMPDGWERQYGLAVLLPDAAGDLDADHLDMEFDGFPEFVHGNLAEYRYERPTTWNEATQGVWNGYTLPNSRDSDNDETWDAWEIYYGRDPLDPGDWNNTDYDEDGVKLTPEFEQGTSPFLPDWDHDGLCDGSRGRQCTRASGVPTNFAPGEHYYGTNVSNPDTDGDGILDGAEAIHWDPQGTGVARDVDGDGLNGLLDADSDGDNLSDGEEVFLYGTDPGKADTDGDGLRDDLELAVTPLATDPLDPDSDDDGLLDGAEVLDWNTNPHLADSDGDGLCDGGNAPACSAMNQPGSSNQPGESQHATFPNDEDSDDDGMWDGWEALYRLAPRFPGDAVLDNDVDRLDNLGEFQHGTVPTDSDTDEDNMKDGWEVQYLLDPLNAADANGDPDADALVNRDEHARSTHPHDSDTEDDGMPDGWEVSNGLNPTSDDAQGDPDSDALANLAEYQRGTLAQNPDTDADTMRDGWEVQYAFNPLLVSDATQDADADALQNRGEHEYGTNPRDGDTDDDGMPDGWEVESALNPLSNDAAEDPDVDALANLQEYQNGTAPRDDDSDDDTMKDGWEVQNVFNPRSAADGTQDADADALQNRGEHQHGTNPHNGDTDDDGIPDGWEVQYALDPTADDSQGDPDGDFLVNLGEYSASASPRDSDTDDDGMPDGWEASNGLLPSSSADRDQDPDGDALTNRAEYDAGTDPRLPDSDDDGLLDGAEVSTYGSNPMYNETDGDGIPDGEEEFLWLNHSYPLLVDHDGDGLTNSIVDRDSDDDGLDDDAEFFAELPPHLVDRDGDGLCDGGGGPRCSRPGAPGSTNQPGEEDYGTDPHLADTDFDGWNDGDEVAYWDPQGLLLMPDVDGDGIPGPLDRDSDNDTLLDGDERMVHHTRVDDADSDDDGLDDGAEVLVYGTNATNPDSDGDAVNDADEVAQGSNPLDADSDHDGVPDGEERRRLTDPMDPDSDDDGMSDGWESANGLDPRLDDTRQDADGDGLSNLAEHDLGTNPASKDSDGDLMEDRWEIEFGLNPLSGADKLGLLDGDILYNFVEAEYGTSPLMNDTDGDGLDDGIEVQYYSSDPLAVDTDGDGMDDLSEAQTWLAHGLDPSGSCGPCGRHDQGSFHGALNDADKDGDRILDPEEFEIGTRPDRADTDGDGLTDYEEIFLYAEYGYSPTDPDSNDDGVNDGHDLALRDPNSDADADGLTNAEEQNVTHTYALWPDSDCDGVRDGAERSYWLQNRGSWMLGSVNLLMTKDSDGDTIPDGAEIGEIGTPHEAVVRTQPLLADSDGDGLTDSFEQHNTATAQCDESIPRMVGMENPVESLGSARQAGPDALQVWRDLALRATLSPGTWYEDSQGYVYRVEAGSSRLVFQGAYGVQIYALEEAPTIGSTALFQSAQDAWRFTTRADDPDSDGDGLQDGEEVRYGLNPTSCDSDGDGAGDAVEIGRPGAVLAPSNPCMQRDQDLSNNLFRFLVGTVVYYINSNPLGVDSDGDGRWDGDEDADRDGRVDVISHQTSQGTTTRWSWCPALHDGGVLDDDTDDDGVTDGREAEIINPLTGRPLSATCWDTDQDGLSDGMELGYALAAGTAPRTFTYKNSGVSFSTYTQNLGGRLTDPHNPDTDGDGIPDGLEDLNANGRTDLFSASVGSVMELDPTKITSDCDPLPDGLELLLAAPKGQLVGFFPSIVESYGSLYRDVTVFKPATLWQTDPRNPDTDGDLRFVDGNGNGCWDKGETLQEGAPDGFDLNPRTDKVFVAADFQGFIMRENCDPWHSTDCEFYLSQVILKVPISNQRFKIVVTEGSAVGWDPGKRRDPDDADLKAFKHGILEKADINENIKESPLTLFDVAWKVHTLGTQPIIAFQVPNNFADSNWNTNLDLTRMHFEIEILLRDQDPGSNNDYIDLNHDNGKVRAVHELTVDLEAPGTVMSVPRAGDDWIPADAMRYFREEASVYHKGRPNQHFDEEAGGHDEDGFLKLAMGDNLPRFFLDFVKEVQETAGNPISFQVANRCTGADSCVTAFSRP